MNIILQQWMQPEDNSKRPPTPPIESASTTTIEDIKDEIIKLINNQNKPKPPPLQRKVNDKNVTYFWSHGITKNPKHNSATCKHKKDGHQDESTLNNRMGGSNKRCKARNNNSS